MNISTLKNMKTIKLLALLFISSLAFTSCSSDDDHNEDGDHEEELITTVIYTLTNDSDSTDVVTYTFTDLDGDGGSDGEIESSGALTINSTYTGAIQLLNETEDPADDVTLEIEEESDEHEFFYSSTITDITITKEDVDNNGNPLGIETTVVTGAAATGSLTVVLKHEPTKPNDGTSSDAGGSTDVEVTFAIDVE